MKRSQAIEKIHEYTSTLGITNGDMTIDEHILEIIEKLGMQPPSTLNPKFQGGWNIDIHPMYINAWEPEDG